MNQQAIGIVMGGVLAILGFIGWLIRIIVKTKDDQLGKAVADGESARKSFDALAATVSNHDKTFAELTPEIRSLNRSFQAFQLEIAKEHWVTLTELDKFWDKIDRSISERFSLFNREMDQRFLEHVSECPLKSDMESPPIRVSTERRASPRYQASMQLRKTDYDSIDPGNDGGK